MAEATKDRDESVWFDWSGLTAVVVCDTCGGQFGPYFSQDIARSFVAEHRFTHKAKQPSRRATEICSVEGCDSPFWMRGMCVIHFGQARAQEERDRPKRLCELEGCNAEHVAKGLCRRHWEAAKGARRRAERQRLGFIYCTAEGCERDAFGIGGLCRSHLALARTVDTERLSCSVDECASDAYAKGMCGSHYHKAAYQRRKAA